MCYFKCFIDRDMKKRLVFTGLDGESYLARLLICLLLVSMNVIYAFESHSSELESVLRSNTDYSTQALDLVHRGDDSSKAQAGDLIHFCHLGHCGFTLKTYSFNYLTMTTSKESSYYFAKPFVFIDEELRPPIFSLLQLLLQHCD